MRTHRGQLILCAWPRKRGPSKSPAVRRQNAWFKGANKLAKVIEPTQQNLAISMTKGTGLYPRDLLLKQMSGGIYDLQDSILQPLEARKRFRLAVMFQGVILQLTADQALPGATLTILSWPLPVFDTLGFWNAGAPKRITIPDGIEIVELVAGWADNSVGPATGITTSIFMNGSRITRDAMTGTGTPGATTIHGPLPVLPGDYFEFGVFCNLGQVAAGDIQTFMTLNVLQAA